ncbi:hypothetical protein PM082_019309 [Marasmius tenuissimus]|nr:hypothetical protein PM082_019309 [Marasmius tenuissimus]
MANDRLNNDGDGRDRGARTGIKIPNSTVSNPPTSTPSTKESSDETFRFPSFIKKGAKQFPRRKFNAFSHPFQFLAQMYQA